MGASLKAEITDIQALLIRQKLKNTTLKLRAAKIKYRWLQSGQLQVSSQGKSFYAKDEDSGHNLLQALKLSEDLDPRRSQKRKHIPTSTPEKNTKFPIREEEDPEPEDIADVQEEDLPNCS
ncbi:UNVERIFIED_CONTAM: hypothetical protein K2H54_052951 [Gekko kuhli]